MKIIIDTAAGTLHESGIEHLLYSKESFEILSRQWLKVGWNEKYPYCFSWQGFPILQIPEDMIRAQEVIWQVKPTVIIETGVAHGGSAVFYAGLCRRIIGIEKGLRCRTAVEAWDKKEQITLIEGDSVSDDVLQKVCNRLLPTDRVMVFLDSCHSKAHVLSELEAYSKLVTPGSYIVATDGSMGFLHDVPRAPDDWSWNNPLAAAKEFLSTHPEFVQEDPKWPFNESNLTENVTHWPKAYLKRRA